MIQIYSLSGLINLLNVYFIFIILDPFIEYLP